jgi:hypothetical protein
MGCYYFDQGFTNPLTITLAPLNPPVQIPANGGSFDFSIEVTSSSSIPQIFSGFIDITLPSSLIYGPVFGPVSITLGAGGDIHCFRTQNIPQRAPAGTYSYNAYAVIQGDTVSDSFPFVKLETGEGNSVNNWDNWGEDFEELYVADNTEPTSPSTFALHPNFPNPFNEKTVISFQLPDAMEVELRIYDIAGREVWRLASRNSQLGTNQMVWNAEGMASGIYFVRLKAGEFSQVQKMVLMK